MTNYRAASEGGSVVRYRLEAGEIQWEIAPGRTVRGYGFNGQVPGPVLEAKQGVPLKIQFTNRLPEPTVVHWHGLRIPAVMDGTEVVQRPVQPGETFTYRFTPPDAGTFWYHPHLNETEQLEKGLYGALIVRAADELADSSSRSWRSAERSRPGDRWRTSSTSLRRRPSESRGIPTTGPACGCTTATSSSTTRLA